MRFLIFFARDPTHRSQLVDGAREKAVAAQQDIVIFDDHGNAGTAIADVCTVHWVSSGGG
jgi:hypothetical protein